MCINRACQAPKHGRNDKGKELVFPGCNADSPHKAFVLANGNKGLTHARPDDQSGKNGRQNGNDQNEVIVGLAVTPV